MLEKSNKLKAICFDFDGTIADTWTIIANETNRLAHKFGVSLPKAQEASLLKKIPMKDLVNFLEVPLYKVPFVVREFNGLIKAHADEILLFPGIKELLLDLRDAGYILLLLTGSPKENASLVLENYDIDFFDEIVGNSNIFSKQRKMEKLLKKYNLINDQMIYIGDETRDIKASKKAGIKIIAVDWGYDSPKKIIDTKPDILAENIEEVYEAINLLNQ